MYAYDVNGDGLNDVITSLDAHGWGLSWYEQVRQFGDSGEKITFKEHIIMSKQEKNTDNPYGVQFSQLHAVELVDIDGDGLKDILTGKTYRAHDFGDEGSRKGSKRRPEGMGKGSACPHPGFWTPVTANTSQKVRYF